MLARAAPDQPAVYLLTNGEKRWINSPAAMDAFNFDWSMVKVLPAVAIDSIPNGDEISATLA